MTVTREEIERQLGQGQYPEEEYDALTDLLGNDLADVINFGLALRRLCDEMMAGELTHADAYYAIENIARWGIGGAAS